jgi:opacity protein-like surface antigen
MKTKIWSVALLACFLGANANAEMPGHFYLGSGAGLYYFDIDGVDFNESAPSMRVFGGYDLNDYLSFEAGYSKFFEANTSILDTDIAIDGSNWDLSVRPTLPLGDQFELFGILGYSFYDFTVKVEDPLLGTFKDSDNDDDFHYGVGGAWNVNNNWTLRGEWTSVNVTDASFGMVSASVTYNFK